MPAETQTRSVVATATESTAPAESAGAAAAETVTVATAETPATETPAVAAEIGSTVVPQLTMVPGDPLQDLRDAVNDAETALRQATAVVRPLRDKVRAVERFLRDREKQYARSEKVIDQLKMVAGF